MSVFDLLKAIEIGHRRARLRRRLRLVIASDRFVDLINTTNRFVEKNEKSIHVGNVMDKYEAPSNDVILAAMTVSAWAMRNNLRNWSIADIGPVAWVPLTLPGMVKQGDFIRFDLSGKQLIKRVKEVLNPGTEKEEIIYNRKRNYYLITSMAINGLSYQKNCWVMKP